MKGIAVMINIHRIGKSLMAPVVHSNFDTLNSQEEGHSEENRKLDVS